MKMLAVLAAASLVATVPVAAAIVVDTGAPAATGGGYFVSASQFLAGKFTARATKITDVLSFIGGNTGTYHVVLYDGAGTVPGAELFAATATATGTEQFQGASGLDWTVAAGSYFAAFEVRPGDNFAGFASFGATRGTLPGYAYTVAGAYNAYSGPMGLRVLGTKGTPTGVPEPGAWMLMVAGLGLSGAALRRRRTAGTTIA